MSEFIIPEEADPDLAEFEVKHDAILVDMVGETVYLSQRDLNGKEPIPADAEYEAMISLGRQQAEALYFALGRHLGIKSGTH